MDTILKKFAWNKYISNSLSGCVLEVDFQNPKALCELHNNYPLVPVKETSNYQSKIAHFHNTTISNVKIAG